MSPYQELKWFFISLTGLSRDALHIYVGLGIFLGAVVVSRKSLGSLRALLLVLIAAIIGEVFDYRDLRSVWRWMWFESVRDVLNTAFWPAVLVVLTTWRARRRP